MWPFSDMTLAVATRIGNIANAFLLLSLIIGVVSTFFIVQTANIKEEFWDRARTAGEIKVAELNTETARLSLEATEANRKIAEAAASAAAANQKAVEARLELARLTSPRSISAEQRTVLLANLASVPKGEIHIGFRAFGPAEPMEYAQQIYNILVEAGFNVPYHHYTTYAGLGLKIVFRDTAEALSLAHALEAAFKGAKIDVSLELDSAHTDGQVAIKVGPRF